MSNKKLAYVWYRSSLPEGGVWCETSSLEELRQHDVPGLIYTRHEVYEVSDGWQPFDPDQEDKC